jgi:hypothetical protein
MGKVSDLAQELRNHATDDHTRGCGGRAYSCECGWRRRKNTKNIQATTLESSENESFALFD